MKKILMAVLAVLLFAVPAGACDFVLMAFDTVASIPANDPFAWKIGHVVDVRPDGDEWTQSSRLPSFWIVRVPTLTVEEGWIYAEMAWDYSNPDSPFPTRIRAWKGNPNLLPANIRNALTRDGIITVNKTQFLAFIELVN